MPAPRPSDPIMDDSTMYLNAVVDRLRALARMIGLVDWERDPPHMIFHHYAARESILGCCKSIAGFFLQEIEEHLLDVPLLDRE